VGGVGGGALCAGSGPGSLLCGLIGRRAGAYVGNEIDRALGIEDWYDGILWNENNGDAPVILHWGQQGKHIPGHNNYDPNRNPVTHSNPEALLKSFSGQGQAANSFPRGQPGFRERVDFGQVIGKYNGVDTTKGIIHYSKKGAHIVPSAP
jgi:hypothetical protein